MEKEIPRLVSVSEFCARHSWARPGGLRALLANRRENGLERACVRLGRRLLLDESRVLLWLEGRREGQA